MDKPMDRMVVSQNALLDPGGWSFRKEVVAQGRDVRF